MKLFFAWFLVFALCLPGPVAGQEEQAEDTQLNQMFVRVTIYPTASMSRYDYNNDINLFEIRAYVELREDSPSGSLIEDARVYIDSKLLDFQTDHYEKRIKVSGDDLQGEINLRINTADERQIKQKFPIPGWLVIESPQPDIIDQSEDIKIIWEFAKNSGPVNVSAYDFKSGDSIISERDVEERELVVPSEKIPSGTIVRIVVMQSWFYKRFIRDRALVRGSEITIIPWSQVFLRVR